MNYRNVALLQKFKKLSILKQALIGDLSREELALLSDTSLELLDLSRELDPEQFESDTEDLVTSPSIPSITIATDGTSLKQGSHSFAPTRRELPSSTHPRHEPFQYKSLADRILEEKAIDPNIFLEMDELTYLDLLPLLAPVTRFSLRELDIDEIILSAQIRHDLYFDPNLQFKANLDGPNGKEKLEQRNEYWEVVGQELAQGHYFRIPLLLHEVTAILKELLPRSKSTDQEIADWIDPVLIAQQIEFQAFNPCSLVSSLAELLKRHCAPARDATVDQMVVECNAGKFTETLCIMFEVLETMKLDYANYQISRVRPFLVEKQLEFEWRWFKDQLDAELQSLENTTQWLCTLGPKSDLGDSTQARFVRAFMALVQAIPTYSSAELPETLGLDQDRLQAMHSDWQDILVTSSLLLHFKQLTGNRVSLAQLVELKETLYVLLNDPETSLDHLVLELAHRVSQIKGTPMTKADQETWMLLIEKVLGSNEPVYQLLSSRLLSHLSGFVQGSGPLDEALLAKHGLGPLFKDISSLGDKMKTLTELNWKIFHPLYNAIFETTEEKSS